MSSLLKEDLGHILDHTRDFWEELRGQRIFITGGTGFFGCWLLESFDWINRELKLGASAVVLARNPTALRSKAPHLAESPAIEILEGDLQTFEVPQSDFTHVLHAASAGSADPSQNPLEIFRTTVWGTSHILDATSKWHTKKMLFTSSGAVYGRQPRDLAGFPEGYPGAPDSSLVSSAYAESKRAAETLCAIADGVGGLEVKIARCFAFVGPYLPLSGRFAIGNFIRDEMGGSPIGVHGDGTDVRSYLYASDLAIWLWTILFRGRACEAYNVGSERAISIAETAATVAAAGWHGATVAIKSPQAAGADGSRYIPCTRKARTELGLREYVDLKNAIRKTLVWHTRAATERGRN